jgi:hypothetical protein
MVTLPVCAPATVGLKVTLMVHDELAATEPPQVSVSANGGPLAATVKLTAAAWLFLTVKVVAALVVFSATEPNP